MSSSFNNYLNYIIQKKTGSFYMKLYQLWPANLIFCLGGVVRLGPLSDAPAYLYAQGMLISSLVLFLVFVAEYLSKQVSVALPIIICFLFAVTQGFVVAINCTDPGIIPPRNVIQKLSTLGYLDFRTIETLIGQSDGRKFCETCKINRPSRSAHCSRCGFCVEIMDHHCPFVNSCIAKRNYQFFTFFLISLNLYIVALVTSKFNALSSSFTIAVIVILAVLILPLFLILMGFFCCHLCLLLRGRTTREMLKGQISEESGFNWFKLDPTIIDFQLQID